MDWDSDLRYPCVSEADNAVIEVSMLTRIANCFFALSLATFLSLAGFAGKAPRTLAGSKILIHLVQISGLFVFVGLIYLVIRLVLAGMKSAGPPDVPTQSGGEGIPRP